MFICFSISPSFLSPLLLGSALGSQTVDEFSATNLTAGLWCSASGHASLSDPGVPAALAVSHTSLFTCLSAQNPNFKLLQTSGSIRAHTQSPRTGRELARNPCAWLLLLFMDVCVELVWYGICKMSADCLLEVFHSVPSFCLKSQFIWHLVISCRMSVN